MFWHQPQNRLSFKINGLVVFPSKLKYQTFLLYMYTYVLFAVLRSASSGDRYRRHFADSIPSSGTNQSDARYRDCLHVRPFWSSEGSTNKIWPWNQT